MSTTATSIFSGTSRFTNDFQQVITRSVAIASLPITQLTNQKTFLTDQSTAVTSLETKFSALSTAIQNLGSATGLSSLSASVSDSSVARLTLGAGAKPASYSLEVQSLGAFTNTLSADSFTRVSDPSTQNLSSASSFVVSVNGVATRVTPASSNLNSLVTALNDSPGLNVQASLVNLGSTSAPDYRLSLQSTKLGPVSLQINDGSSDLLNTISTGTLASYKINGLPTAVQSDSRTVTLAPGITAQLTGQSAADVSTSVVISRQSGAVGNALSALVNAYNSAADEVASHRGASGGALTGNSLIQDLGNKLRSLGAYSSGSGQISSLAAAGVTFDGKGHLVFDQTAFSSATATGLSSLFEFLGTTSGGGFLQAASKLTASVSDADSGELAATSQTLASRLLAQQALIDSNQARVDQLKTSLQAQLAKADAQVAVLEQSYSVLTGIYQAQQTNSSQYK